MRFRSILCTTLLLLCHAQMRAQVFTKALPPAQAPHVPADTTASATSQQPIPDDPGQQILPIAQPVPEPPSGTPIRWEAGSQSRVGELWTLSDGVVLYYRDYVIRADRVIYHHDTGILDAEGHLQVEGGQEDISLTADHGTLNIHDRTGQFYNVTGSLGVRRQGGQQIYSTANPFLFHGRMLLQLGQSQYRIIDGAMTSCRLPRPDWQLISRVIDINNTHAAARNSFFELFRLPILYLPYVAHNASDEGRQSGFVIPAFENSGLKGFVIGDWYYWAINRSTDMLLGTQYWSRRGWAPSGDFRYRGSGLDALTLRWNALIDRGIQEVVPPATTPSLVKQGGQDVQLQLRRDLTPNLRLAGYTEYLSSYIYRLAFDEALAQATSSEVTSEMALTWNHNGFIPSGAFSRFQTFAGTNAGSGAVVTSVPEARILHLPALRFDVLDRPIGNGPIDWSLDSSAAELNRAEPGFHARNVGRADIYPHIEWPIHAGDWNFRPEFALRLTEYSGSQIPDLSGDNDGIPTVSHDPLTRADVEVSFNIRPPVLTRDFTLPGWNRELRHVIEPELRYRYVHGISKEPQTLIFDTTDIATDTNEAGYSLTQRFYLKPLHPAPCPADTACRPDTREWASWQVEQDFYINPTFSGAVINNRRNVFDATLESTGVAFLTSPRNIGPIISRLRFEAIQNLRAEWDLDYDTKAGRFSSDNLFLGYSIRRATFGLDQALLNAVDESGSAASNIQSHLLQPFLIIGKPADTGLSFAINSSYDVTQGALQYGGVQAVYNWNCCGLNVGYRRFELGTLRNEAEWLYGFTLSGIGTAGNIHRSTSVFPTPDAITHMY